MARLDPTELLKVHHTTVDGDGTERITQVTPYMALRVGDHPILFLKAGKVWDAGGREITNTPPGFWGAVSKCVPERVRECGFEPSDVQNLDASEDKPEKPTPPIQAEPVRRRR